MATYRVRASNCAHSILVDATSSEESKLFGAIFFLFHRLVVDLEGDITAEPWNQSVEPFEYVSRASFDGIIPHLERLIESARIARLNAGQRAKPLQLIR